jgi:outer membrane cobalamin receptor
LAVLRAQARPSGTELSLTARLENATNVRYENVAGYRTPARMLFVGLRAVH